MTTNLLDGLRVLDLSLWQPGHTATQLLADLGADVIKVEPPGGDRMRPQLDRFATFNGHKRSIVLDLKSGEGRETLLRLAATVEVLVENNRPGVADRLGVGFEALRAANPAIVLCSITGFGQDGPLAGATGHDHNYQAYAGAMTLIEGEAPRPAALLVGDQGSGLAAAFAILAAVLSARRTGQGEHIDVSIADLLATWVAPAGIIDPRRDSGSPVSMGGGTPGIGAFRTRDGEWVELGVYSEDHLWDELCRSLSLDQHVGIDMPGRTTRHAELRRDLQLAIGARDRDELVESLGSRAVPIAPVLTREEMLQHPHFRARGVITTGPDGYTTLGHPIQYKVHPARRPGSPPPSTNTAPRSCVL